MSTTRYTAAEAARRLPHDLERLVERLLVAGANRVDRAVGTELRRGTPVDTGEMRSSWQDGRRISRRGQAVSTINVAPHARIIDSGRHRSTSARMLKRYPKGRTIGSTQAPKGVSRPAVKRVFALREAISAAAIREAEGAQL